MTMTRRKSLAAGLVLPGSCSSSARKKRAPPTPRSNPLQKRQNRIASVPSFVVKKIAEFGEPDAPAIAVIEWSAVEINRRATALFPNEMEMDRPCVSARMFACFDLHLQNSSPQSDQSTEAGASMKALLCLLRSLVAVEAISLGPNRLATHKKIHFCGVDLSSTLPPVDRVDGSDSHQQESLEALVRAKEEVDALLENYSVTGAQQQRSLTCCLVGLRDFLNEGTSLLWLSECAKAIDESYSPRRVSSAVRHYYRDFGILVDRLEKRSSKPILLEERLAELVGQAIRYQLRMFFNGPPIRLGPADTAYEKRIENHSKVHSLIDLIPEDEDYVSSLAGEKWISGLVSLALCRLTEYFGLDQLMDPSQQSPDLPGKFCASLPANRGIPMRGLVVGLSEVELDQVKTDVDEASSFLAAARACKFLVDLWSWPGVQKEIQRQGGWSEIETYASWSWKYTLWKLCPDDAHLVVLCNFATCFERLRVFKQHMEPLVPLCAEALEQVAKRFRVKTKSKNLVHKFPEISILAEHMEQSRKVSGAFPFVEEPRDTSDEEW